MELLTILILTLIVFPVVTFSEGIPRIILGVVFLLIFPGYTLTAALFPGKNSLSGISRVALTLVLSFALVSLAGLALNYTPWGIRLTPIYIAVAVIILITSVIALFRRTRLPKTERFSLHINIRIPKWRSVNVFDRILYVVLVIAVVGAIATMACVIAKPKTEEAFTNFYILGPEGKMENYPQELALGQQVEVTLGIENHEHQDSSYNVMVTLDGKEMQTIGPISLTDDGKWSAPIVLSPFKVGDNQKVEFLLFKSDETAPYLTLHLWLDVKE